MCKMSFLIFFSNPEMLLSSFVFNIKTLDAKIQNWHIIRECGSTLYVGMPRKQNGRPIHCIVKLSPQNAAIGKF